MEQFGSINVDLPTVNDFEGFESLFYCSNNTLFQKIDEKNTQHVKKRAFVTSEYLYACDSRFLM